MDSTVPTRQPIQSLSGFAGILKEEEIYATHADDDFSNQINGAFDRLMKQSGLDIPPSLVLSLCLFSALTLAGTAFVIQENLLITAIGAFVGFLIPFVTVVAARTRRQQQITKQLPAMIEELARSAKTGRSVEQCLRMVTKDTPSPLGTELQHCIRRMDFGMDLTAALEELPERTGLVSLNILVTALTVHQQTGGDLVSVLDRLSRTIRDRLLFLGRLRAATIGSRATAILMLVLPVAIIAFFVFRDPNYIAELLDSTWGRTMTIVAVILEIIGSLWIFRIFQNSQQA